MGYYEKRLENDLTKIKNALVEIAGEVQIALKNAVASMLDGNEKLAYETVLGDRPINRQVKHLDRMCLGFIALHLPAAGHLRFIASTMRLAILLERIGDYSATICREAVQLPKPPEGVLAEAVKLLANDSQQALSQAISAFRQSNLELAKNTMQFSKHAERTFDQAMEVLVKDHTLERKCQFNLLLALSMLLRVAAQAKNICEETVFVNTGQGKPAKLYNILYLDEDNSCLSQMAEAITRKKFSGCGTYASAGRKSAGFLDQDMVKFLENKGVDMAHAKPKDLDSLAYQSGEFYLIISLQGPVKSYMEEVPFHSIALEWDLKAPQNMPHKENDAASYRIEEMYRTISLLTTDLMEKLCGDDINCCEG